MVNYFNYKNVFGIMEKNVQNYKTKNKIIKDIKKIYI